MKLKQKQMVKKIPKHLFFYWGILCLLFFATGVQAQEMIGDVNNDNSINILDALNIAKYAAGQTPQGFITGRADVNCDNTITIVDALMVARYTAGLLDKLCDNNTSGPVPFVYDVENTGANCQVATSFPEFNQLKTIQGLPDPFLMENGTRISKKSEWTCRRAEISAQIQYWGTGTKPPPGAGKVSATFSGNKLTVVVQVGFSSVTLSTTISYPSNGTAPYPALIKMDGSGVPSNIFTDRGCAVMNYTSSVLAPMTPSYNEKFQQLFPDDSTAGSYIGWAWGASRLIDGLYLTKDQNKIDVKHLAVTGCSYAGKMALYVGAFDERIALTIPEESGGGGEASWRVMANQSDTENLEVAQGTSWYSKRLKQFKNPDAVKLPYDMHELVAMVAPRAIIVVSNTSIARLGSEAGYVSMKAASEVWKALGVPERIGYTQYAIGGHCTFPGNLTNDVASFVDRFLLGKTGTNVTKSPYNTNLSQWIPWQTPVLQ